MSRKLNRIKTVLVDQGRTNKWLAEQLRKDPATVSKWCTNTSQPSLEVMMRRLEEMPDPAIKAVTNN